MRSTALTLTLLLAVVAASAAEPAPAIFAPDSSPATWPALGVPYTALGQWQVDFAALDRLEAGAALRLDLAAGLFAIVAVDRCERRSATQYSLFGHLPDDPASSVILVREQDALALNATLAGPEQLYQARYLGPGRLLIVKVDTEEFMPCGGALAAAELDRPPQAAGGPAAGAREGAPPGEPLDTCQPEPSKYDAMIVYTDDARAAAGGTNAINAQVQLAIDLANESYANSQIVTRTRLVYRGEFSYAETGNLNTDLHHLTLNLDGVFDPVHALRDQYHADTVGLWVANGDACGLAWCNADASDAFSVTVWDCYLTYAHEVGHNQGCAHDQEHIDCDGRDSWSRGWRFYGDDGVQYRTVMAYAPGNKITHFSNPNVSYQGQPTGVPIGDPNEAYNARTINDTEDSVRNFRLTRMDVWVDFANILPFPNGTFGNPYPALSTGVNAILVPVGGSELPTLWIKSGASAAGVTLSKAMAIRACGGLVRLGD